MTEIDDLARAAARNRRARYEKEFPKASWLQRVGVTVLILGTWLIMIELYLRLVPA